MIEITGTDDKIDRLIEILRPYGLLEVAKTGRLAMSRGQGAQASDSPSAVEETVDAAVSFSV